MTASSSGTYLEWIPSEHRSAVLRFVADVVQFAHQAGPEKWGLRCNESLMLKVGPHEVLQIGPWPRPLHIVVDSALVPSELRARGDVWLSGDRDWQENPGRSGYYSSNPGTEACEFGFEQLEFVADALDRAHSAAILQAARKRRHSSTVRDHSAEFLELLANETHRTLQQPAHVEVPPHRNDAPGQPGSSTRGESWQGQIVKWAREKHGFSETETSEVVRIFEHAVSLVRRPERAWFGVHEKVASIVVGGIFLAAVRPRAPDRGIWLLLDADPEPPPVSGVEYHPVKSATNAHASLLWGHAPLSSAPDIAGNDKIWASFASASEKVLGFPIGRGRDAVQRRRGKIRVSTLRAEGDVVPQYWWFGVNGDEKGHVQYASIVPLLRGDVSMFEWPFGGTQVSIHRYEEMRAGDRVAVWMGDSERDDWGIVGYAEISEVHVASAEKRGYVTLRRLRGATRTLTPYTKQHKEDARARGTVPDTEEIRLLRTLFEPTFQPLGKVFGMLGLPGAKKQPITVDRIQKSQFEALLARASPDGAPLNHPLEGSRPDGGPALEWTQSLSVEEYVSGLSAIDVRVSDLQRRLLRAHYSAPNRAASASDIARIAGVDGGHPVINVQYGRLARMFLEATQRKPDRRRRGTDRLWSVWSRGYRKSSREFVWEMLPAVAQALERLGWVVPVDVTPAPEAGVRALDGFQEPRWRAGTMNEPPFGPYVRGPLSETTVTRPHADLQNELAARLREKFGSDSVVLEQGYADVALWVGDGTVDLFEVKVCKSAWQAICDGLGQLLWYRFRWLERGERVRTIVIAAAESLQAVDERYLEQVQKVISADLRYLQIHPDVAVDSYQWVRAQSGKSV